MNSRGWSFADNKLEKEFKFTRYFDIVNFANEVMQIAIELDHHPEIFINYNFVKIKITDFEKGSVSQKCLLFIARVDAIKFTS